MSDAARTPVPRALWVATALFLAVLLGILAFHALTYTSDSLLAPSGPQETVLRAVRLAGIEQAAVGESDGMALLRIDLPAIASAPDVEIGWQVGFSALTEAYPAAAAYTVQLFVDAGALLELQAGGDAVRSVVDADDAAALRSAFESRFIAGGGESTGSPEVEADDRTDMVPPAEAGRAERLYAAAPDAATELPDDVVCIDVHLAGAYLDAKNRAAGLLGDEGPTAETAAVLAGTADANRAAAPPVRAPEPGESVLERYAERLREAVAGTAPEGLEGLLAEMETMASRGDRAAVSRVRSLAIAAEALAATGTSESLLADARDLAALVADTPLAPGALSDAVLAAAGSDDAPESATDVRSFERDASLDVESASAGTSSALPGVVLRLHARGETPPVLGWTTADGNESAAPEAWLGYRRADGTVYWMAGQDGAVALSDGSLLGWAFSKDRASIVDALNCGRVLAYLPVE
jgi:hypothetical protein